MTIEELNNLHPGDILVVITPFLSIKSNYRLIYVDLAKSANPEEGVIYNFNIIDENGVYSGPVFTRGGVIHNCERLETVRGNKIDSVLK